MNDWNIKTHVAVVIAFTIAFWGVTGLELAGFPVPVIQQIICLTYILWIPGTLILRLIGLHPPGRIETLLYSVGLSVTMLMFTGFAMNTVYPLAGISTPLSPLLFVTTIGSLVLVLSVLCFLRVQDSGRPPAITIDRKDYLPVLVLILIPCLSVLGAYVMNTVHISILLMVMLIAIGLVAVAIGFGRLIPEKWYPLAVFVLPLSLLLHKSLISNHLWGWDIFHEYYLATLVIEHASWDSALAFNTNAMLSIVSLVPAISSICAIEPVWVLKIVYPFLFCFVPLGLYRAVQKQTNEKTAFFAMFFFISIFSFYTEMLSLARQQIAELFLVMTILVMIDKSMDTKKQLSLLILFGASMIVSHYGLTWIYLTSLIAAWVLLVLPEQPRIQGFIAGVHAACRRTGFAAQEELHSLTVTHRTITLPYVLFFAIFTLLWYITFSSGTVITSVYRIAEQIGMNIFDEFLNPESAQGLGIIMNEAVSPLHTISRSLHFITIFFIIIGIGLLVLRRDKFKFEIEYRVFSVINFLICIAGVALPFFASALNASRLYHITLIFLAPFCVIGAVAIITTIYRRAHPVNPYPVVSIFFVIFLFFNAGLVDEIAQSGDSSLSLDSGFLEGTKDYAVFNDREVAGANWLNGVKTNSIYVDANRWWLLLGFGDDDLKYLPVNTSNTEDGSYLFLGTYNIQRNTIRQEYKEKAYLIVDYIEPRSVITNQSRIFANGGAEIYRK